MKKSKLFPWAFAFVFALVPLSCGSPKTLVKVRNNADNTETTISATTGNGGSTSVTVSPRLEIRADSTSIKLR